MWEREREREREREEKRQVSCASGGATGIRSEPRQGSAWIDAHTCQASGMSIMMLSGSDRSPALVSSSRVESKLPESDMLSLVAGSSWLVSSSKYSLKSSPPRECIQFLFPLVFTFAVGGKGS